MKTIVTTFRPPFFLQIKLQFLLLRLNFATLFKVWISIILIIYFYFNFTHFVHLTSSTADHHKLHLFLGSSISQHQMKEILRCLLRISKTKHSHHRNVIKLTTGPLENLLFILFLQLFHSFYAKMSNA